MAGGDDEEEIFEPIALARLHDPGMERWRVPQGVTDSLPDHPHALPGTETHTACGIEAGPGRVRGVSCRRGTLVSKTHYCEELRGSQSLKGNY